MIMTMMMAGVEGDDDFSVGNDEDDDYGDDDADDDYCCR